MNQEVGSIVGFLYNIFPVQVYDLEVPQNFKVPSMYFPAPVSFNSNDTNQTFLKSYTLSVKLFHKDSQQAYDKAEQIIDAISANRDVIPLLENDGSETGNFIRFNRVEARIADSGVATIILNWDSRYFYHREPTIPIRDFEFKSGVK